MPNINDINGVTVANLAKLDAVLKANISKVNGLTLAAAFTGLLDTYTGAAAGYSTRRLASSATNLMRIREDVGDTETDIGYDSNGDLDTAAIASHCGSANGYVVTWYDQSGNSNNATQSTGTSQPQIYNGTAVITDNGKPTLVGSGSQSLTLTQLSLTDFGIAYTGHLVLGDSPYGKDVNDFSLYGLTSTVVRNRMGGNNVNLTDSGLTYGTQLLSFYNRSSGSVTLRRDGSQVATSTYSDTVLITTVMATAPYYLTGNTQEFIVWNSTQDANFSGIETNINNYFSVY